MTTIEKVLITYPEFHQLGIRFSRQHINRLMSQGRFPRPIRLGGEDISTKAHWRFADILDWIEQRARASGLPDRPRSRATDGQTPERLALPAPAIGSQL